MKEIHNEFIRPPEDLLYRVEIPDVPECTMDDCVAKFIAEQNRAIQELVAQTDSIREWSK